MLSTITQSHAGFIGHKNCIILSSHAIMRDIYYRYGTLILKKIMMLVCAAPSEE